MKAIGCVSALLVLSSVAYAQVEVDDMYFNSKDRAKEKEAQQKERVAREERLDEESKRTYSINPTDSYSSRRINPEYSSQLKSGTKDETSDSSYFISGYQPTNVNKKLSNSYASGGFAMPYYGNNWGNPYMMNSFGYNGFGYSPYSMWNDPFYNGFGSPYSYGFSPYSSFSMGMGWGFGSGSWYPYSSFGWNMWSPSNLFWNNYYNSWAWGGGWNSWGNPYCGFYNRYPSQVIVIDNGRPRVVYGKRNDRSSSLNNPIDNSRSTASYTRTGRETTSNGRTRTANNDQAFYDRNWRQNHQVAQQNTRSYWGNESNTSRTYTGGNNSSSNNGRQTQQRTSSWNNNSFNNSNNSSWSAPSNSGGGSRSYSAPTRSSSSGSGGGSTTRSRGRD